MKNGKKRRNTTKRENEKTKKTKKGVKNSLTWDHASAWGIYGTHI